MIKQLREKTESFQCYTTDLKSTWPTSCTMSSTMTVIDKANKKIDHYEYFDGEEWVKI